MSRIRIIGDKLINHVSGRKYIDFPYKDDIIQIDYYLREYVRIFNSFDKEYFETISETDRGYLKHILDIVIDFLPLLLEIPPVSANKSREEFMEYFRIAIVLMFPDDSLNKLNLKTQYLEKCQNILDSMKKFVLTHTNYITDVSRDVERMIMITETYQYGLDENYKTYVWFHKLMERGSNIKMIQS